MPAKKRVPNLVHHTAGDFDTPVVEECIRTVRQQRSAVVRSDSTVTPSRAGASHAEDLFSREQILRRYWDLANLDPEQTKGNITGQIKALDSLREELVMSRPKPGAPTISQEIYQSAWLRSARVQIATSTVADE